MGAEGLGERDFAVAAQPGQLGAHPLENRHVRAAKGVDRLAGIAHQEEAARLGGVGQRADDVPLGAVGVLKFVYQNVPELGPGVTSAHPGVMQQQVTGARFQVVEVERGGGRLGVVVHILHAQNERCPQRDQLGGAAVQLAWRLVEQRQRGFDALTQRLERFLGFGDGLFVAPGFGRPAGQVDAGQRGQRRDGIGQANGYVERGQRLVGDAPLVEQLVFDRRPAAGRLPGERLSRFDAPESVQFGLGVGFPGGQPVREQVGRQRWQGDAGKAHDRLANLGGVVFGEQAHGGIAFGHQRPQRVIDDVVEQDARVDLVEHAKARVDAGFGGVGAQDGGAQAVEGVDAGAVHRADAGRPEGAGVVGGGGGQAVFQRLTDAVAHFAGRLLGEGDGDERVQRPVGMGVQQRQVTLDEDGGLAGAGPGHDDDVAVEAGDGALLVGREIHGSLGPAAEPHPPAPSPEYWRGGVRTARSCGAIK